MFAIFSKATVAVAAIGMIALSFTAPAMAQTSAAKWSACKLACDNAGGGPVVVKYCKSLCDSGTKLGNVGSTSGTLALPTPTPAPKPMGVTGMTTVTKNVRGF